MAVGFVGVIFMALALLVCTFLIGLTPLYLFHKATNGGNRYSDLPLSVPSGDGGVGTAFPDTARQEKYIRPSFILRCRHAIGYLVHASDSRGY